MTTRLIALDIDGTIVHPHSPGALPSPRVTRAICDLTMAGVAVVLASGRMLPGTASIARHLGLETPLICQQGCSVHAGDGSILHEFALDPGLALDLVGYARERDHTYEWFNPIRYLVSRQTPESEEYGRVSGITPEYLANPEHAGVKPTGVGIISSPAEANTIHRALTGHHGETLHLLDFPSVTVAVAPDANKGHALSIVAKILGIDRHEVVAVGDSTNDAAMLAWAGAGYAMAHADVYARDAADTILEGDAEEAIAGLLESILHG